MKKLLSLLLCVVMLCTVSVTAFADGDNVTDAVVSVGTVEGKAGESVIVPVSIQSNPGFGALTFTVTYDSSVLSISDEKVTPGAVIEGAVNTANSEKAMYLVNTAEAGKIYVCLIKAENITGDGVLFNAEFTVAEGAKNDTEISLTVDEMADETANLYTGYTAASGGVTLASVLYGDVNGNTKVGVDDALLTLQNAVGKITLDETQTKAADVDAVAGVSVNDALLILQYAVGKIIIFPVEM